MTKEITIGDVKMLANVHSKFREIILRHRPGTLDAEMPALITICAEAAIVSVNTIIKGELSVRPDAVINIKPGDFKID